MRHSPLPRAATAAMAVLALGGCDLLMTEPAERPPDLAVSFAFEDAAAGGTEAAFDRVNRVFLRFTRKDGATRDTVVRLQNEDGVARARLAVEADERIEGLGIYAVLAVGDVGLFEGATIVRIQSGTTTTAEVPLVPIPALVQADRPNATYARVGDTLRLSSAVLFASRDTIPNAVGVWSSADPAIVAIASGGLSVARAVGQTVLIVRSGELTDTVQARVLSNR